MARLICPNCMKVYSLGRAANCPDCGDRPHDFTKSDEFLKKAVALALEERKRHGLEGLVGGLECVIVNTERDRQKAAVKELLRHTGLRLDAAFENGRHATCILKTPGSADFLVRSRKTPPNPFAEFNIAPKSAHLPDTRLETFVFATNDLEKYVSIQKSRGVRFLTPDIIRTENYDFIQTVPSGFTGNSIGFIQWKRNRGDYAAADCAGIEWNISKPALPHLKNIGALDHAATRLRAEDRDAAIIEFMDLTSYNFDFAIYVRTFNSITSVARLTKDDYAMVFTTGIAPFTDAAASGPTEEFVHNYNRRVHHVAFRTENIEQTFAALKADGMKFLIELVGSPEEGLKQTFTAPSPHTLLVKEYIHRYGGFDGFFTRSNVTLLTAATGRQ